MTGQTLKPTAVAEIVHAHAFDGDTPQTLFTQIHACLTALGRDVLINFDSSYHGVGIRATFQGEAGDLPRPLFDALYKITSPLLGCEIEDWHDQKQTCGRLMIGRSDGVFLDCEDIDGDWDYQRYIDLETLADMEFPEPKDGSEPLLVPE